MDSKKGFLTKILHRRSLSKKSPQLGSPPESVASVSSRKSHSKTPSFGNVGRHSSYKSSRRYSSSDYVDGDNTSVYDYDTDDHGDDIGGTTKDDTDSDHFSLSSVQDQNGSPTPGIKARRGRASRQSLDTLSISSGGSDFYDEAHNRVAFPVVPKETLDQLNLCESDDLPWAGLTYDAFIAPKYIKANRRNKHSPKVLNHLFLAQELNDESVSSNSASQSSDDEDESSVRVQDGRPEFSSSKRRNQGEIFVLEFSRDGKYLAAAGRDSTIKIWKVISSPLGRLESKQDDVAQGKFGLRKKGRNTEQVYTSAPVFHQKPCAILKGHSKGIVSLDWSKNNFLISGSMDRTAKLWHVDRPDCLQTFAHEDFVTALKFHPTDDRFFLSGSLDNHVRLWSILEGTVSYSRDLGDKVLVTALGISPDGEICTAGGFNGSVFILEVKGLHVKKRFDITDKSLRHPFEHKNGNRITGIKLYETAVDGTEKDPLSKWAALLTTNDSKIRLIDSTSRKLVTRFKGLTNNSSSLVASSTDDNRYIICGSEDHSCYVWENNNSIINNRIRLAVKELVHEGKSHIGDMHIKHGKYARAIKDNKFLKKFLEPNTSEYVSNENSSYTWFHAHHSRLNAAVFAPDSTKRYLELSDDIIFDLVKRGSCFTSESIQAENTGHIIVSTDQCGSIRVFRQDSAYVVRKNMIRLYKRLKSKNQNGAPGSVVVNCPVVAAVTHSIDESKMDIQHHHKRLSMRSLSPVPDHFPFKLGRAKSTNSRLPTSTPSSTSSTSATLNTSIDSSMESPKVLYSPKVLFSSSLGYGKRGVPPSPSQGMMFKNDGFNIPVEDREEKDDNNYQLSKLDSQTTLHPSLSPTSLPLRERVPQIQFAGIKR